MNTVYLGKSSKYLAVCALFALTLTSMLALTHTAFAVDEGPTGTISIAKSTDEVVGEAVQFDFDGGPLGTFMVLGNNDDSWTSPQLSAGSYTITEVEEDGWMLGNVTCDIEDSEATVDFVENESGITINLLAGQNVSCTFNNELIVMGCTDSDALNYNDSANRDDESCQYPPEPLEAPDVTLDAIGELACGVQDVGMAGLIAFPDPTTAGAFVVELDNVVVIDDRDMDDALGPDGDTYDWSNELSSVGVGAHTIEVIMYADEESKEVVLATASQEFSISPCAPPPDPTYRVFGYVWDDQDRDGDENGVKESNENPLEGWVVTITDGRTTYTDTTDANGLYEFFVPVGTWTIDDGNPSRRWRQTYPETGTWVVEVTGEEDSEQMGFNFFKSTFASMLSFFATTVYAQGAPEYGPFNFGNDQVSNGGGTKVKKNNTDDEVEDGEVLGEATTTLPVGAPNTGAGGTAHGSVPLVAILGTRITARRQQYI